ncbi:hypothetical protein Tco_1172731 [Tanacetum coccineum]
MNPSVHALLGKFVIVLLNDILIYSKDEKEHKEHLKVLFSGIVIDVGGIHVDLATIGLTMIGVLQDTSRRSAIFRCCAVAPILALPGGSEDFWFYYGAVPTRV